MLTFTTPIRNCYARELLHQENKQSEQKTSTVIRVEELGDRTQTGSSRYETEWQQDMK